MSFYTYEYLMNESNLTNYVKYGLTIVILLFLSFVTFKYMRDKLQTKYRDLSIIFCLLLIFIIGIQFTDYSQDQNNLSQSAQMAVFIESVSNEEQVPTSKILVNTTSVGNDMIIKLEDSYYQVELNPNLEAYHLKEVKLLDKNIDIVKTRK